MSGWIDSPAARSLAWALVQFVWEGALVAAMLWIVLLAGRSWTSPRRHLAALVALMALPLAFVVTLAVAPAGNAARVLADPDLNRAFAAGEGFGYPAPLTAGWQERIGWVTPVWMAGVLLFYLRSAGGWMVARQWRRTGVVTPPGPWRNRFDSLRSRLGISRCVTLLESCFAEAPVVIGLVRPVILVPGGLMTGLTPGQLEAILVHELEHVRRFDSIVSLFQSLIEGLLFYHPAVWWISSVVRAEREHCCDDAAVAFTGDAQAYAAALASMEESRVFRPAMAANGGSLVKRIRRLLNAPNTSAAAAAPAVYAIVATMLAALALAAWQRPAENSRPMLSSGSPYEKWLKDDVAYIITDEERAAFSRLKTDEEREHFIEQFWLRRDPTPATVENEFKEEHYRRIAYANERFALNSIPGWKTDRGRIYVVRGPADEIESHPVEKREVWLYHRMEGIGENVQFGFEGADMRWSFFVDGLGRKQRVTMPR